MGYKGMSAKPLLSPISASPYLVKRFISTASLLLFAAFLRPAIAGEVTVQWSPVTSDPRVAGYEVHYGLASGQYTAMVDAAASGAATNTRTITNLTDGRTYFFAVRARIGSGASSSRGRTG